MKSFKTFALVMVAAWVAVSASAKTGADGRSLDEARYQQADAPQQECRRAYCRLFGCQESQVAVYPGCKKNIGK